MKNMSKRISAIFLSVFIMTSGMLVSTTYGATTADKAIDYSAGILKAGSYEGYAHIDNMNYSDYDTFNVKGNGWVSNNNISPTFITESEVTTASLSFNAAGPLTYTKTGAAVQRFAIKTPNVDVNGNARPVGATYAEIIASTNKYTTNMSYISIPAGGTTQAKINAAAGKIVFRGLTAGSTPGEGTEIDIPSAGSAPSAFSGANQMFGIRTYQELGDDNANKKMWGWTWNAETGTYSPESPIMNQAVPRWSASNTSMDYILVDGGASAAANPNTSISIYEFGVYEPYERQLRDAVIMAEKSMLGQNDAFDNITKDLTLPVSITLDRGMSASISWSSSDSVIGQDGVINPPLSGSGDAENVKLTGSYTVNGNTKIIEYTLTIKEGSATATDEEILAKAADSIVWSDLSDEDTNNVTEDLKTLPADIISFAINVPVTWNVTEGESTGGGAGVVLSGSTASVIRAVNENTKVVLRATFAHNGKTETKDFSFYISKSKTSLTTADKTVDYSKGMLKAGSYEDYAFIVEPNYVDNAAAEADGFTSTNATGTMSISNGKPNITGQNGRLLLNVPATDSNGNSKPAGNGSETYAISKYSMSANNTKAYASIASSTSTRHSASTAGTIDISTGTAAAESYVALSQTGYTTPAANDICSFMILQRPDNNLSKFTSWFLNETKNSDKDPIFFRENYETRWGRTTLTVPDIVWSLPNNTSFNGSITVHSAEVYERDEYLFREAAKAAEKDISFDSIEGDLTLLTQISDIEKNIAAPRAAQIVWTSDRTDVIANDGTVTRPNYSSGDQTVKLTAVHTINGKIKTFEYTAIVKTKAAPPAADIVVNAAADVLIWTDLSNESQTGVTTNFTSLPLTKKAYEENVSVSWSITEGNANAQITGGNAVNITRPLAADAKVVLRATLSYGGETAVKDFTFYVTKTQTSDLIYTNENYALRADGDITAAEDVALDFTAATNRWIKFENGKGLTINNSAGGAESSAIAVLDLKARTEKEGTLDECINFESDTVLEFTVQPKALNTSVLSQHFSVFDDTGKQITYLQFTNGSTVSNAIEVNLKCDGAWKNPANTGTLSTLSNRIRTGVTGGNFPAVKFKIVYNRMSNMYSVHGKLASETDSQYIQLVANATPNDVVAKGAQMSKLRLDSRSNASNAGAVTLKDVKMYTTEEIVKNYILNVNYKNGILGGQNENGVSDNLAKPVLHYGTVTDLVITNTGESLFDSDGKLLVELAAGDIRTATVTPTIRFTKTKYNGNTISLLPFDITVKGMTKSLIYKKTVTVSGATTDTGSNKDNINDGFYDTEFITSGSESSFTVTFDMLQPTLFNRLTLREGLINATYNVGDWSLEGSNNKSSWTKLAESTGIGLEKVLDTIPPYIEYRYVRLIIENKLIPSGKVSLAEILLAFEPDEAYKNTVDFEKVPAPPSSVSEDFYLQGLGEIHKSQIKWESFDTSVLKISDTLDGERYRVTCIRPEYSKDVTVKVTVGTHTKNYTVRVIGTYTPPTGGGGGGGGSFSGGGVVMPKPNETPEVGEPNSDGNYFPDMDDAQWAIPYVDFLKEKGIVSGDNNGNFNPQNNVTREEFAKMIVLTLKLDPLYEALPFNDVSSDHWAYSYVSAAYKNSLIQGILSDSFGTGRPITRQDMAVIIARAIEKFDISNENEAISFADEGSISDYAIYAVERLSSLGVFSGDENGNFRPMDTATRAEASKVLCKLLELI